MNVRFNSEIADKSLAFFETDKIPKVSLDLPHGVSEVRFKADLTGVPKIDLKYLREVEGLFRAAALRAISKT